MTKYIEKLVIAFLRKRGYEVVDAEGFQTAVGYLMRQRKDLFTYRGRIKAGPPPKSRTRWVRANTYVLNTLREAVR